jgi:hypothetical protein
MPNRLARRYLDAIAEPGAKGDPPPANISADSSPGVPEVEAPGIEGGVGPVEAPAAAGAAFDFDAGAPEPGPASWA